jgi:hypothetical protein
MDPVEVGLTPEQVDWLKENGPQRASVGGNAFAVLYAEGDRAVLALTFDALWVGEVAASVPGWVRGWMTPPGDDAP